MTPTATPTTMLSVSNSWSWMEMGKRREFDRALPNEDVNYVNYDMDDNLVGQLTNYDMQ